MAGKKYTVSQVFTTDFLMKLPNDYRLLVDSTARQVFAFGGTDPERWVFVYEIRDLEPQVLIELDEGTRIWSIKVTTQHTQRSEVLKVMEEITGKMNSKKQKNAITRIFLNRRHEIIYPACDPNVAIISGVYSEVLPQIIEGLAETAKTFMIGFSDSYEIHRVTYSQILYFFMGLCSPIGVKSFSRLWDNGVNKAFVQEVIFNVVQERPELASGISKIGNMFIRKIEEGYSTISSIVGEQ